MQWPDAFLGSTYFPVALASRALIEVGGEGKVLIQLSVPLPCRCGWLGLLRYSGVSSSSLLPCVLEAVTVFSAHSSLHEFLQRVPYKKPLLNMACFLLTEVERRWGGVFYGALYSFSSQVPRLPPQYEW